jgi:hypothetical protein
MEQETINPFLDASKTFHVRQVALIGVPLFIRAIESVPDADVRLAGHLFVGATNIQLKYRLAFLRWANPICDQCFDEKTPEKLVPCLRCGLVWYCSTTCQHNHAEKHAMRCGRRDGPLDTGPQQLAAIKCK